MTDSRPDPRHYAKHVHRLHRDQSWCIECGEPMDRGNDGQTPQVGVSVNVEIEWSETVTYRSVITVDRDALTAFVAAEISETANPLDYVREWIDAGEESDWLDQLDPREDLTAVTDRSIDKITVQP